jgi:nucleotide-binding universal stress UspA family protein
MVPGTRTLTFGDDRSAGADAAWSWVTAHPWPLWEAEVVTVTIPRTRQSDVSCSDAEPRPWIPPEPRRAPASCGFGSVRHLAAQSDPRLVLGQRAGSDLVVVGHRGQGLLKALHLGSTAEWLMRCPTAPLVIARKPQRTRSILVCVDGSRHAQAAVEYLGSLPWVAGTTATVLGVVQWQDDLPATVNRAARELSGAGVRARPMVVEPDLLTLTINPHLTIVEQLDARNIDLVVLGTSGKGPLRRIWVGSVASAVARHADCSVLVVRDVHGGDDDGGL